MAFRVKNTIDEYVTVQIFGALIDNLCRCFMSGKYSDLRILCGAEHEFKVHKIVICPQSEYFSKVVDEARFKVSAALMLPMASSSRLDGGLTRHFCRKGRPASESFHRTMILML